LCWPTSFRRRVTKNEKVDFGHQNEKIFKKKKNLRNIVSPEFRLSNFQKNRSTNKKVRAKKGGSGPFSSSSWIWLHIFFLYDTTILRIVVTVIVDDNYYYYYYYIWIAPRGGKVSSTMWYLTSALFHQCEIKHSTIKDSEQHDILYGF